MKAIHDFLLILCLSIFASQPSSSQASICVTLSPARNNTFEQDLQNSYSIPPSSNPYSIFGYVPPTVHHHS